MLDGINLRFAKTFAAGVSSFERIVREKFNVRPPRIAVEVRSGRSLLGGANGDETKRNKKAFAHEIHLSRELGHRRIAGRKVRSHALALIKKQTVTNDPKHLKVGRAMLVEAMHFGRR